MRIFFLALIPALWILWLTYWIAASIGAKEAAQTESVRSRLSHQIPMIIGGILLGVPDVLGAGLERRFHPHNGAIRRRLCPLPRSLIPFVA